MNPDRLRNAYARLQSLDDRLTYKIRPPRSGSLAPSGGRSKPEQLDERLRDLASFTIELKEVVEELILACGTRPKAGTG